MYLLQYFKHKEIPGCDYLPQGCEQMKHGVIYDSYLNIVMHELLRWLRIERQQQPAGWIAAGIKV